MSVALTEWKSLAIPMVIYLTKAVQQEHTKEIKIGEVTDLLLSYYL